MNNINHPVVCSKTGKPFRFRVTVSFPIASSKLINPGQLSFKPKGFYRVKL